MKNSFTDFISALKNKFKKNLQIWMCYCVEGTNQIVFLKQDIYGNYLNKDSYFMEGVLHILNPIKAIHEIKFILQGKQFNLIV